jgi:hypothetical protein
MEMMSYPCPHCGQRTISFWQRVSLGPAWPTRCQGCRGRVGVPWRGRDMGLGFVSAAAAALITQVLLTLRAHLSVGVRLLTVVALLFIIRWAIRAWWRNPPPLEKR